MSKKLTLVTILVIIFISSPMFAKVGDLKILSRSQETFTNTDCEKNATCDLKEIKFLSEDYGITLEDGDNYGTRLYAQFETNSMDTLENYVFVNFIKGCPYETQFYQDGLTRSYEVLKVNFDNLEIYKYPKWTIDSLDTDPTYFSAPEKARHHYYRWNTIPNSFDEKTEKLYGKVKPTKPQLYVRDHPSTAFFTGMFARNISLQFKMCLYKAADVPFETTPDNINFAEPIYCYNWYSSFVFNHDLKKYEYPYEISSFCQQN